MNTTQEPKETKKLPRWGKILLAVVGALIVIGGAAGLYINGKLGLLRYSDGSVAEMGDIEAGEDQDLDGTGLVHSTDEMEMPEGSPFADEDVVNILLIGTDERTEAVNDADAFTHLNQLDGTKATTEFSEDARADSLILVSLDIKDHTIRLVSIERGLGVPILLDGYEGEYDWITHTFRYGGAKLTMETVQDVFNVEVDHYVRINFNSFVQIVDAVGGVDIDITDMEAKALNWEVPSNSMLIVNHVDPGLNHFDGYTALQYARLRKIDNDWHRIERQRTVIQAVLDQVKSASVAELDNLLNTVLPLVQTNFTKTEIAALLVQLPGFLGADVQQLSMPLQGTYGVRTGMDNRLMYDPDWFVNTKALQDFLYHDQTAEEVIAATPESAEMETAETARSEEESDTEAPVDTTAEYLKANAKTLDLTHTNTDAGNYDMYIAGLEGTRDDEVQQYLIQSLYAQGVRTLVVPGGYAAGVLLDDYLQSGRVASLQRFVNTMPKSDRAAELALWQAVYARYPRVFHAVGMGTDKQGATTALAVKTLLRNNYTTPDSLIAEAVAQMKTGSTTTALYWFRSAMTKYPRQMEKLFGDDYASAVRLHQALMGTLLADPGTELMVYDVRQAEKTYPNGKLLVFTSAEDALQTGNTLAACLRDRLKDEELTLGSYVAATGEWDYDGTFAPANADVWDADSFAEWLGEAAVPGKDMLLTLDGEDSPFNSESAFLTNKEGNAADIMQRLLILHEKTDEATPETADAEK